MQHTTAKTCVGMKFFASDFSEQVPTDVICNIYIHMVWLVTLHIRRMLASRDVQFGSFDQRKCSVDQYSFLSYLFLLHLWP